MKRIVLQSDILQDMDAKIKSGEVLLLPSGFVRTNPNYQPERSKREDSSLVRCMESESEGYFVSAQVSGTNEWIGMRCSEHDGNIVREVQ